jgi:hypothetical protein
MSSIRKLIVASVAALALLAPGALPSQFQAPSRQCQAGQVRYYTVYYRSCPQDYWHVYGSYLRPPMPPTPCGGFTITGIRRSTASVGQVSQLAFPKSAVVPGRSVLPFESGAAQGVENRLPIA